jgi:hypothetical protein
MNSISTIDHVPIIMIVGASNNVPNVYENMHQLEIKL